MDKVTLLACSDALADAGHPVRAAWFGELASAPNDPASDRLVLAWRLCRAGRPDKALAHLGWLRDDAHPMVPLLRAAALAFRDRTPAALAAVLREASVLEPSGIVLRVVAATAFAVGDRATALDAACRFLATASPDDPEMRRIVAPAQAMTGDVDLAVASAELARIGHPADPDRPIGEIVDELRAAGDTGAAIRLLATAFHRTGRPVYGELLVANLPKRVLHREGDLLIAMLGVVGAFPAGVLLGPIVALPLAVVGIALFVRAVLVRAPGCGQEQTNRINKAATLHRRRSGTFSPWTSVAAAVTIVMTFAAIVVGRSGGRLTLATSLLLVGAAIPVAALTAGGTLLVRRRQRARLVAAEEAARVAADRCRCWERDRFGGPAWRGYRISHLVPSLTDPATGAVLLRCPTTGTIWLYAGDVDLTVRLRFPEGAEQRDLPTGA